MEIKEAIAVFERLAEISKQLHLSLADHVGISEALQAIKIHLNKDLSISDNQQ